LTYYVASIAPPDRAGSDPGGEAVFMRAGCGGCHAERGGWFSDLCIHDLGSADGENDPAAPASIGASEYRASLLWGLRFRDRFLHDGRAATLDEAIAAHGGAAAQSASNVAALSAADRAALFAFLATL
jgi:CxxC motif-containing protein (DUF1111 family)